MKPFWYMGVDPGINGAMAMYCEEPIPQLCVHDFITVKGGSSTNQYHKSTQRNTIAITETANIIVKHINEKGPIKLVLLEVPHSMPNDGHVGAFNFGKACGVVDGILGTLACTVIPANPAAWKSHFGLSSNKQKSVDKAKEIFEPSLHHFFIEKKKSADRAEAALLAWYAFRTFGGNK